MRLVLPSLCSATEECAYRRQKARHVRSHAVQTNQEGIPSVGVECAAARHEPPWMFRPNAATGNVQTDYAQNTRHTITAVGHASPLTTPPVAN